MGALSPDLPQKAPSARSERALLPSYAPANGALLGEVPVASPEEVRAAIARAHKAQRAWGLLEVEERVARLTRFRDALVARVDEIVDVVSRECGKPREDVLAHEVLVAVDLLSYYIKRAPEILAPRALELHLFKHKASTVHYVPRGVVGVIGTWNFPFVIPMGDALAALVTGSAVVAKPSETTPLSLQKAKEIWDATGLPEDLFQVVHGGGAVGQALVTGGIQKLCFTGGVATGKRVAALCGEHLVPCVMELGGKAPLLACSDCDVERTARAIVFGGFANAGQVCISVERVYAHARIHDALVARVGELTRELRQGDPAAGAQVDVGAIIFEKQIEVAERHVHDALAKGATLVAGGKRVPGPGQFFEPTVLVGCDHSMSVMKEEIFGPIVPIQRVTSEEEAVRLANDSHLGLNAYVFTKDRHKGERLAAQIEAGSVVINDVLVNYGVAEAPFGGVKQSGFGRIHGDDALRDMATTRHVLAPRLPSPSKEPFWFPYPARAYELERKVMRALYQSGSWVARLKRLL